MSADDDRSPVADEGTHVMPVTDVPDDGTTLITVRDVATGEKREALLVRLADGVAGWLNYCKHWTDVRLDTGSGAPMRGGDIACGKHGATFDPESGECDVGPCEGAFLDGVDVTVRDGGVYLTDDDYAFVDAGGIERDPVEKSTNPGSRLGF